MPKWDFAKLRDFYESHVPEYAQRLVARIRNVAKREKIPIYLVGGGARELLRAFIEQIAQEALENQVFDIDICALGDGIHLAKEVQAELGGILEVNPEFLTAKLVTPQGYTIDFTTARTEVYEAPGRLPVVVPTNNIFEDLMRRDFAVNALAFGVSEENFGEFCDPAGGVGDIFDKQIRVLHPLSFYDDPTRLFRALRYSVRLGYHLDTSSEELFRQAIEESYVDFLTPERIRYELECALREQMWFGVMWMFSTTDLLASVHPAFSTLPTASGESAEVLDLVIRAQEKVLECEVVPSWVVRLNWCLLSVEDEHFKPVLSRCGVYEKLASHMSAAREKFEELRKRMNHFGFSPSRIYRVLVEYPRKTLLFVAFNSLLAKDTEALRANIFKYLSELSPRRNILDGERLMELGAPKGPILGKIQEELWWKFIDGDISSSQEAEQIVPELLRKYREANA